jgi:hypothetical protein
MSLLKASADEGRENVSEEEPKPERIFNHASVWFKTLATENLGVHLRPCGNAGHR